MPERYQITNKFVTDKEAYASRVRAARRGGSFNMADPVLDETWAALQLPETGTDPYYDYFFAGEDIQVWVGETADDPKYGQMPIHNLAFQVEQQKMPLYGYWNYTYNHMMRGTRVVTGQFTLISTNPNYMKELLTVAAKNRAKNHRNLADDYPSPQGWRSDDENITKYWGKHIDASAKAQMGSVWSAHPPFSLVILYGVQGTSVEPKNLDSFYDPYKENNNLLYDHNQRLVESSGNRSSRIVLDGCELTNMQTSYQTGMMVAEQYQFIARDIFIPREVQTKVYTPTASGGRQEF